MLMVSVRVVQEEEEDMRDLTEQLAVMQANDPAMAATSHYTTSGQQLASTQEHTMAPNRTDHQLMLEDDNNMITSNHDPSSSS